MITIAATNPPEIVNDALEDPDEIPSDDFHTFPVHRTNPSPTSKEQVAPYIPLCVKPYKNTFRLQSHPEMEESSLIARKLFGLLATSAPVERAFSLTPSITSDYRWLCLKSRFLPWE
jgi:hypothetical protein